MAREIDLHIRLILIEGSKEVREATLGHYLRDGVGELIRSLERHGGLSIEEPKYWWSYGYRQFGGTHGIVRRAARQLRKVV